MTEPHEQPADPAAVAAAFAATSAVLLGSGGYGDTYMMADVPGIGGSCAVKLLKPASYDQHRAEREMDGMRRFTGPGAARLLEVRTLDVSGEERVALVCEFIPGGNVQQRIDKGDLPNFKQLRKFAIGLLKTVAQLHGGEACHRDIKPLNILLRDGKWSQPVLIDFGMYRVITDPTIRQNQASIGATQSGLHDFAETRVFGSATVGDVVNSCGAGAIGGLAIATFGVGEATAGLGFAVAAATGCGTAVFGLELGQMFGPAAETNWAWFDATRTWCETLC